jgi:thiamine-monophosphate kinase
VGLANAMMDISDGLVADLGHICKASRVSAVVEAELVPLSPAARAAIAAEPKLLGAALAVGDDYELLLTAAPDAAAAVLQAGQAAGVTVTRIGRIEAGAGVRVVDGRGAAIPLADGGYRHF